MIIFLLLIVMVSAYVIANAITHTNAELAQSREDRTMNALRQAKAALIAHAASEEWQLYKSLPDVPPVAYFQPGALPCPDQDNDGDADCFLPFTSSMIGRLPWRTLGIDDLRDSSGERLWYALSHDFRKLRCSVPPAPPVAGCTTINSDTLGQLKINGSAPATQVVAIVFAPGQAIQGQIRDAANANNPSNYLELFDLDNPLHVNYIFTSSAPPSDIFNDRLLAITQADLMAAVEPIVAASIQRDIKPVIQSYYSNGSTGWNAYPFPAPFSTGGGPGRAQALYTGAAGTTNGGLLPVTNDVSFLAWQPSSIVVTQIPGGTGTPTINSVDCSASTTTQISCRIDYGDLPDGRPAIQIQATLQNAARSFPAALVNRDLKMTDKNGDDLSDQGTIDGVDFAYWSAVDPKYYPTATNTALANGDGQVVFKGKLQNPQGPPDGTGGRVTIRINVPSYLSVTDPANATTGWFVLNQWYRQTYFAVSPGYLPGGGSACNPLPAAPSCLTVSKLPPAFVQTNDKQAILILAGRSLGNAARPSNSLPDYLESANLSAAQGAVPYQYEHRAGVPTTINDRVVVVAP